MTEKKTLKQYATCWGFNFNYYPKTGNKLECHHEFSKEFRSYLLKEELVDNFIFKLEKNPNIKDHYHYQGHICFIKNVSMWQCKVTIGRKDVVVQPLEGPEDVARMIMYVCKDETQAGDLIYNNRIPDKGPSIEYDYSYANEKLKELMGLMK